MKTHRRESLGKAGTQAVPYDGTTAGMSNSGGIEDGKAATGGYDGKIYGADFKR